MFRSGLERYILFQHLVATRPSYLIETIPSLHFSCSSCTLGYSRQHKQLVSDQASLHNIVSFQHCKIVVKDRI